MSAHSTQHCSDRSDSQTLSPIPTSKRGTWNAVNTNDDLTAPPKKRIRLEESGQVSSSNTTTRSRRRLDHSAYTVGWVAALPLEIAAATAMLDEVHEPLTMNSNDSNLYVFGNIGDHNVVIACLPSGQYGIAKAALVANNMRWSFPSIKIRLMVGIGGGVPGKLDIRLGDVVVSNPTSTSPGVIQYDFGKTVQDGRFQLSGALNKPPQQLLAAVAKLRASHESQPSQIPVFLAEMVARNPAMVAYTYQGVGQDRLYEAAYDHNGDSCDDCDLSKLVRRQARSDNYPRIHYGVVASANQVMKHGQTRDRLAQEHDVICFEMEAAGLMDSFPCLVIRGICDYSDSHKIKRWQEYAASSAAAYAKELLTIIPQSALNVDQMTYETLMPNISSRSAIIESMKFGQMDNRHSTIKNAHARTCQWLAKHTEYVRWLDPGQFASHHGVMWISGKPGAGKSTIMKFAFCQAKRRAAKHAAVLSFFFNARGDNLEKTTEGMHRSLLVQLLEKLPELQEVLEDSDLPALSNYSSSSWNLSILRDIFSRAISKLGQQQQVTCFIDALDECAEDEVRQMLDFFEDVGQCAVQNGIKFYVCFSSRHYPHIEIQYGIRFTLEDQSGHEEDLEDYVRSRLRTGTTKQADELTTEILQKASGVFMWVVLVIDILNKEFQRGRIFAVKKRLREIPPKLSDLFRDILTRDGENMDDLLLAVQWVLFGRRPLRREEFYFALVSGLEPDSLGQWDPDHVTEGLMDQFVTSSSKGLAEMTKTKDPRVQFIHESVRDFLLKDDGLASLWPDLGENPEGQSHDRLKKCCLAYTRTSTSSRIPTDDLLRASSETARVLRSQVAEKLPFLEYATNQVLYHANVAARLAVAQDQFIQEFSTFLPDWVQLSNMFEPYKIRRYTQSAPLLYVVVNCSLASLVEPVIRRFPPSKEPLKERYKTILLAALHSNDRQTVRALLPHLGPDEIDEPGEEKRTALWTAVKHGRTEAVEILLNAGANPESIDNRGLAPVTSAVELGNETVVNMLLNAGASSNVLDGKGSHIIFSAVEQGHEGIVRLFLSHFSANKLGETCGNTSSGMPDQGNDYQVRPISANVDCVSKQGYTPLQVGVLNGHIGVARLLLDAGADVNSRGSSSWSPLTLLIRQLRPQHRKSYINSHHYENFKSLLELLLNRGADVCAVEGSGITAYESALLLMNDALSDHLFDAGATIVRLGGIDLDSALVRAVFLKQRRTCNLLLLKEGASANATNDEGCSALEMAIRIQDASIFWALIDAGADISRIESADLNSEMECRQGRTLLHNAVENGQLDRVKTLLHWGADVDCTDARGNTPLHLACAREVAAITTALASRGANIRAVAESGLTPITAAIKEDRSEQVKCLLRLGVDANMRNDIGETLLFMACERNAIECGRALIEAGTDVMAVDLFGNTALFACKTDSYSVSWGSTRMLVLMLEAGMDPLHRNNSGGLFFEATCGGADLFLAAFAEDLIRLEFEVNMTTQLGGSLVVSFIKKLTEASEISIATEEQLLRAAVTRQNLELLRFLVGRGCNPNCVDFFGRTLLIQAIDSLGSDQANIVSFLLDNGVDVNKPTYLKETALQMSIRKGLRKVEEVLRSKLESEAKGSGHA